MAARQVLQRIPRRDIVQDFTPYDVVREVKLLPIHHVIVDTFETRIAL